MQFAAWWLSATRSGIPVKYVCLVDYANSRGAADMGLLPDLGPGLSPAGSCRIDAAVRF